MTIALSITLALFALLCLLASVAVLLAPAASGLWLAFGALIATGISAGLAAAGLFVLGDRSCDSER